MLCKATRSPQFQNFGGETGGAVGAGAGSAGEWGGAVGAGLRWRCVRGKGAERCGCAERCVAIARAVRGDSAARARRAQRAQLRVSAADPLYCLPSLAIRYTSFIK